MIWKIDCSLGPSSGCCWLNSGCRCDASNMTGNGSPASSASLLRSSPSWMRSWMAIETQKMISSMHGFEIVESMYSDDVELYLTWLGSACICVGNSSAAIAFVSFLRCPGTLMPISSRCSARKSRSRAGSVQPLARKASWYFSCAAREAGAGAGAQSASVAHYYTAETGLVGAQRPPRAAARTRRAAAGARARGVRQSASRRGAAAPDQCARASRRRSRRCAGSRRDPLGRC